jgi:hypothetical protein
MAKDLNRYFSKEDAQSANAMMKSKVIKTTEIP